MRHFFHSYSDTLQGWIIKNTDIDFTGETIFDTAQGAMENARLMNLARLPKKYRVT